MRSIKSLVHYSGQEMSANIDLVTSSVLSSLSRSFDTSIPVFNNGGYLHSKSLNEF